MDPVASDVELIPFKVPEDEGRSLYVSGLPTNTEPEVVWEELNALFSQFGLVNDIHIPLVGPTPYGYGFVRFYSQSAAGRAQVQLDGRRLVGGSTIRVQFAARRQGAPPMPRPLHYTKCQELANHYLGFAGWSSRIVTMAICESVGVCYKCTVELEFKLCDLASCQGVGRGEGSDAAATKEATPTSPLEHVKAIGSAKKLAYHRACENAFSRVVLAVLPNGKALPWVVS